MWSMSAEKELFFFNWSKYEKDVVLWTLERGEAEHVNSFPFYLPF